MLVLRILDQLKHKRSYSVLVDSSSRYSVDMGSFATVQSVTGEFVGKYSNEMMKDPMIDSSVWISSARNPTSTKYIPQLQQGL